MKTKYYKKVNFIKFPTISQLDFYLSTSYIKYSNCFYKSYNILGVTFLPIKEHNVREIIQKVSEKWSINE